MADKKYCRLCGRLISDKASPSYNPHRHSRVLYCGYCRETMQTIWNRNGQKVYKQKLKEINRKNADELDKLRYENEILRGMVNELRNKLNYR